MLLVENISQISTQIGVFDQQDWPQEEGTYRNVTGDID